MLSALPLEASHSNPAEWLFVAGVLAIGLGGTAWLVVSAPATRGAWLTALLRRGGDSLERISGLPAWAASGVALQIWGLLVAGIGFYWDVAWHIDLGRDTTLFTPPHVLILMGLIGFAAAGAASILYATLAHADVGSRVGRLHVPRGGAALLVIGATAALGFPLDDLWHATYGIDVTMWSPTHLMMIGAAVVSPFAAWVLLAEARGAERRPSVYRALTFLLGVGCLLSVAALQLEFDDGVPQWQALYQPVLIAIGAALPLAAVRLVLGRGFAVAATLAFLGARTVVAALIGPGLGHVTPHFPLYLGIALCVEAGFALAARRGPLVQALAAGVLAGTVGLATEWGFSHVFGREPWQPVMLGAMWLPALAAVGAAVLGTGFGLAVTRRPIALPRAALAGAALAALAGLVIPLPRNGLAESATVLTSPAGPKLLAFDRYGQASLFQSVHVEVDTSPQTSALLGDSDWFWVNSWQGGGRLAQTLVEVSPGRWVAPRPVPTGAAWKTVVLLGRGDVVAALPVALPSDPAVGVRAIPLVRSRTQDFAAASRYLMPESHSGAKWIAYVIYALWLAMIAAWLGALYAGASHLAGRTRDRRMGHAPAKRRVFAPLHSSR